MNAPSSSTTPAARPALWLIVLAFASVYTIWGSSYIGIRFAVETIPPFLMAGSRFLAAGLILFVWSRLRGAPMPTRRQWMSSAIASAPMFLVNNSLLVWSQAQGLPSGIAAVVIASTPMWVVLLQWLLPNGKRPGLMIFIGIALSSTGIILLSNPAHAAATHEFNPLLVFAPAIAAIGWAIGSLYARKADLPDSSTMSTGTQLLTGGVMVLLLSVVTGDAAQFNLSAVTLRSALSVVHLTLFSSVIAFTAFTWLMRVVSPARAMTYAYINPVIAVFLGWLLAGETLDVGTLISAAIIISGVFLIVMEQGAPSRRAAHVPEPTVTAEVTPVPTAALK
ncbi:MAG: EamA family transporter [Anaerolineae bacterium]